MSQNQKYYCFPAVAASATASTDVLNKGGYLQFAGNSLTAAPTALVQFPLQLSGLKNGVYKAWAAESARVITITPTAANSTDYRIVLSAEKGQVFSNNLPNEVQAVFTYTTKASGDTATTISAAFIAAINAHPFWSTRVTASGSSTIVLTAKAGFPIFSAGVGANLSQALTNAGSPEYGATGANLLATGYFTTTTGLPVSGTNYGVYIFENRPNGESIMATGADEKVYIYVVGGGNNTAMITALTALLVK